MSELEEILQELSNTVYRHGQATRTNTPFHYGEPIKEAKQAIEAYISKRELELLDNFVEEAKNLGFERYDLVVEYQDGTNSGVIPFREHWNRAYDRFLVAIDWYKEKLNIGDK